MKTILSFLPLILTINSLFAQFENIDLSDYKLPDLKRHQLDFMFEHSNGFTNDQEEKSTHLNFDENLDANYTYFFNSRKRQSNYLIGLNSNFNFDKEKEDGSIILKEQSTDFLLAFILDERFYLKEDEMFIHLGTDSEISFSRSNNKQNIDALKSSSKHRNWNIIPQLELGAGLGRIEPVSDFRQAIYILDELFKNKRLDRLPTENEVVDIGLKISQLKNKRFFDSRLRKIDEIKSIDSLLNNMGILEEQDAVYFTILNDMWDYGREERFSGTRIQFDLAGGYYYSSNKSDASNGNFDNSDYLNLNHQSYGAKMNLDSYKPIKLEWQRYFNIETLWMHFTEVDFNSSHNYAGNSSHNRFVINSNYRYDWYLNTRTMAHFGLSANYTKNYRNEEEYLEGDGKSINFNGGIYYYFSPRLRLIYDIHAQQRWLDLPFENEDQSFVITNHLKISYAIF